VNTIREGVGVLDGGWLTDNISRKVGDGSSTLFRKDPWLEGISLEVWYHRLFELTVNKLVTVAEMFSLGWGLNGEAWKWQRWLFVWEEEMVGGMCGTA